MPNQINLFNEYKISYAILLGNGCDYTLFGHKPTKDQRTAGTVPHNMSVSRPTTPLPFQWIYTVPPLMIIFSRKCIRLCVLYVVSILCVGIYFGGFSGNHAHFQWYVNLWPIIQLSCHSIMLFEIEVLMKI